MSLTTEVVYDRLPSELASRPGADGHAGIEGLERPAGQPKLLYRELRQAIADACDPDVVLVRRLA
jgi:hypothetical protein